MSNRKQINNVFEAILEYGHDEDFVPNAGADFIPTDAIPGSMEKIEALRQRIVNGMPLWHGKDRNDFIGLAGTLKPRE
jgi:hypothetical protein